MDSPKRQQQKRDDYARHKMFRKIARRRKAARKQAIAAPEKELRRRLRMAKYAGGKLSDDVVYETLDGTPLIIKPSAYGASELKVTTPDVVSVADPDDVARGRAARWYRDFGIESNDATSVAGGRRQNSHLDERGVAGATKAAAWAKEHPYLNAVGIAAGAAPFAVAATPAVVGGGELTATALANPYVDALITSGFGAHGIQSLMNGTANWETALELAPLGRLLKPTIGAGKFVIDAGLNYMQHLKGMYRRARNFLFLKKHGGNVMPVEDYISKAWDAERKASTIAMRLNDDSPFLFRGDMTERAVPGGFSQQVSPISVTIDGQPVQGTVTEYAYGPGGIIFTPKFGKPTSSNIKSVSFDSDYVPIEFSSLPARAAVRRFLVENNPEFNLAIAENISKLEAESGAPVVGSSRLISENLIGGAPGDVEMIVPKSRLQQVLNKLKFKPERKTANNTGWTGRSEEALLGSETNNLDINVLDDSGTIIHQMESTRNPNKMPKEYSTLAKSQQGITDSDAIKRSVELNIPKDDGSGFYTAEEYFDLIKKDPEMLTQSVVDNTFKSNKDKHVARAFVMMNSDNPSTVKKVSTAIDHMVEQIPGMKRFSLIYKSQSFNNVEKNKQILQEIGFAPMKVDKFASNPEQMKNIVDYWYMRKTVGARSVNFEPIASGDTYENVMSAVRQYNNGDSAGGGGNTILGGRYGGFTRNHTSYSEYRPYVDENLATFDDVLAAFEREKNIWKDKDTVNNAIRKVLQEEGPFIKIDSQKVINNNSYKDSSTFTSRLSDMVTSGELTHEEANYLVQRIAEELGVSGIRGLSYGLGSRHVGDYFGAMRAPQNVAYRNIDSDVHNSPILPAEFGSDEMFFLNNSRSNSMIVEPETVSRVGRMSTEDAVKNYPENVIDMRPYHQLAEAMQNTKKIRLSKRSYDNDVLAEASGLNKARSHRKLMESTYYKRYRERSSKMRKYLNNKEKRHVALQFIQVTGSLGAGVAAIAAYSNHRSKMNDAVWEHYRNNQKEIDQKIEKRLGLDFNDKDNWSSEDWRKFDRFVNREYRRYEREKTNENNKK